MNDIDKHDIGILILLGIVVVFIFALLLINMKHVHELDMYKLTNNCKVEVVK